MYLYVPAAVISSLDEEWLAEIVVETFSGMNPQ